MFRAVLIVGLLTALPALAEPAPQPACWFYVYRWVKYDVTGGAGNFQAFPIHGMGNGITVTEGKVPGRAEKRALEDRVIAQLPRKKGAPAPAAKVIKVDPIACPVDWPSIPGVPPRLLDRPWE
jgi:hypothetical protein